MKTVEEALEEAIRLQPGITATKVTWAEADQAKAASRLQDRKLLEEATKKGNLLEIQRMLQSKNSIAAKIMILDWRPIAERG